MSKGGNRPKHHFVDAGFEGKNPMPRIVTALFKERAKAQQGLQALMAAGIAQTRITTIGLSEGDRDVSSISGFRTLDVPHESHAALQSLELPEGDRSLFRQGLQRGCVLMAEAPDDLGSADLRADETAHPGHGLSTTTGTGARREDARADREGVNEL